MTGQSWDASYHGGPDPWDFGGPQPVVVRAAPRFTGKVLDAVTKGTLCTLCSSEGENAGPHPVKREALTKPFGEGWRVKTIEKERVRTGFHDENGAPAWFATIEREPSDE